MKTIKTGAAVLSIAMSLILLTGFGSKNTDTAPGGNATKSVTHYIDVLKKGTAQQKAAAAYWLGQQHSSATQAIDPLTELLGDKTAVNPTSYRDAAGKERKPTLGEEAAAALVQIGRPSIAPLIRVLKTSPSAEARKNAAWALGALHDTVALDRSAV